MCSCVSNPDDTGMFYGVEKLENDLLLEAGSNGSVYSEMILRKDERMFTLNNGWAFPRKLYFNGDECIMPLPVSYPSLPNSVLPVSDIRRLVIIQVLMAIFYQLL